MEQRRQMGLAGTIAVVTGESIALGIFLTPAAIAKSLGSPMLLAAVWCGMGLITMCGALCYSEMAVRFPHCSLLRGLRPHSFVHHFLGDMFFSTVCRLIVPAERKSASMVVSVCSRGVSARVRSDKSAHSNARPRPSSVGFGRRFMRRSRPSSPILAPVGGGDNHS